MFVLTDVEAALRPKLERLSPNKRTPILVLGVNAGVLDLVLNWAWAHGHDEAPSAYLSMPITSRPRPTPPSFNFVCTSIHRSCSGANAGAGRSVAAW